MGRAGSADDYIRKAISLNPMSASSWATLGHLCVHYEDTRQALMCADKINELSPGDSRAVAIRTKALANAPGAQKMRPAEQIRSYENILRQNPEDDDALSDIGLVHYNETKDYKKAEEYFRESLRIDPSNKHYQKLLIMALRKRDPVLRLLWLPFTPVMWILNLIEWTWEKKWPLIFMIFLFKYFVVIGVAMALMFFCVFWPVAKVYEYLTIADVHKKMGRLAFYSGPMAKVHKAAFGVRFGLFLLIVATFWTCVYFLYTSEVTGEASRNSFAVIVGFGVVAFFLFGWGAWIWEGIRKRQRARKNKKLNS